MIVFLGIVLLAVLLFFAALTAASETSIIAASRLKLRRLAGDGSKTAKSVLKILEAPERLFGTILVANNIVDVLIASITTVIIIFLIKDETRGIFLATVIASILIIVSEVAAKTIAAKHSEKLSMILSKPLQYLIIIFSPIVAILSAITNAIVSLVGVETTRKKGLITVEEIKALIKIGEEEGVVHEEEYRMLTKVFEFNSTLVKDVMTSKKEVVSIDADAPLEAIIDKVLEFGYSRVPVYKENPENIIGMINMKDLLSLSHHRNLIVLHDIIYPPTYVPRVKKVTELLKEFQKGHTHLALVTDDQGKVEGIVTLEDLIEQIVGEIEDESDIRSATKRHGGI